jgi:hypothetical protein
VKLDAKYYQADMRRRVAIEPGKAIVLAFD